MNLIVMPLRSDPEEEAAIADIPELPILAEIQSAIHESSANHGNWLKPGFLTYTIASTITWMTLSRESISSNPCGCELSRCLAKAMIGILDIAGKYNIDLEASIRREYQCKTLESGLIPMGLTGGTIISAYEPQTPKRAEI